MREKGFNRRIGRLNEIVADEIKTHACARYVDVASDFVGAKGQFLGYRKIGGKWRRIRDADGIHLTGYGGALITERVINAMRRDWEHGLKSTD